MLGVLSTLGNWRKQSGWRRIGKSEPPLLRPGPLEAAPRVLGWGLWGKGEIFQLQRIRVCEKILPLSARLSARIWGTLRPGDGQETKRGVEWRWLPVFPGPSAQVVGDGRSWVGKMALLEEVRRAHCTRSTSNPSVAILR